MSRLVEQELPVQLILLDQELRGFGAQEFGDSSHQFQEQPMVRASFPGQVLNNLCLFTADGQAILLKENPGPIQLELKK
jgi:hypothetical protein